MPRVTCPCGARYKFPESSLGRKSKCRKCGVILTLEADEEGILAVAPEAEDEHVSAFVMQAQAAAAVAAHAHHDEAEPRSQAPSPTALRRSYGADVLWTFLFPSTPSNLITFALTCLAVGILVPAAGMAPSWFGLLFFLLVSGWYASFRFEVIRGAAAGQDDLPNIEFTTDWWGDGVEPFLNWVESWVVVLTPAVIYLVVCMNQGTISGFDLLSILFGGIEGLLRAGRDELWLLPGFVWAGLCAWPIVVLCIALGGLSSLARLDLIVVTVFRTLPGYLVTLSLMLAAVALRHFLWGQVLAAAGGAAPRGVAVFGTGLTTYATLTCLGVYIDIVLMRLIGLYYHHFKRNFAWEWE